MQAAKKRFLSFLCLVLALVLLASSLTFLITYSVVSSQQKEAHEDRLRDELISLLREQSLFDLDENANLDALLYDAIVAATGDPYAEFFTEEEYLAYQAGLSGSFVGIGVVVNHYASRETGSCVEVLSVYRDSPAEEAGMKAGDLITHVDGVSVSQAGYAASTEALAGQGGTAVTLQYLRGGASHTVTVTRDTCEKQTVYAYSREGIGYVRITSFDRSTAKQFISAVTRLEQSCVTSFVFDLRYNGGGLLYVVCQMLAFLLPDGVITTLDYAADARADATVYSEGDTLYMQGGETYDDPALNISHSLSVPVAILTNGSTASASELFTAALRDYSRDPQKAFVPVTVVGETTYGKGCVQETRRLTEDTCYVKLTVALYNPPSGVNFHGKGIIPDVLITGGAPSRDLYLSPMGDEPVLRTALGLLTSDTP